MDSIILHSVSKTFRRQAGLFPWSGRKRCSETIAIDDVSLCVPAGSALALLGPNGSGKTTLLKLIAGVLLPDRGEVVVGGLRTSTGSGAVRKRVGFLIASERSFYPRLSVRENLEFFASLDEVHRGQRGAIIEELIVRVGLSAQRDTLAMRLSSGMYQKLAIARVMLKQPSVVLLDEPTRSLDAASAEEFWLAIKSLTNNGSTVILATHNFEEACVLGDSFAILRQGRLVDCRTVGNVTSRQLRSVYADATSDSVPLSMAVGS